MNPRTQYPVDQVFVDLTTSLDTESASSQLSGKEILGRKVSVQLARKPAPAAPVQDNTVMDLHPVEDTLNEQRENPTEIGSTKTDPGPALNWNSVNRIKIRTSLGGDSGKSNIKPREIFRSSQKPQKTENAGRITLEHEPRYFWHR